ncbi:NUDIX hydrolase [Atopomonas hussainii]|uniref:NUDIX hydrolase n=1 Tax=Atopomonas hussainii TaxID=1429083 RepID=UPI0009001709|nr:NUDIX domain-containing protein [Atopomonas hussainii]
MEVRKSSRLFIVNNEGDLLLFLYKDEHQAPFWATAGGELKPGESYTDAAARELYEETGLTLKIGPLLKERDEVYAVARSTPARWLEKYYLVECPSSSNIFAAEWTEEEKRTIQKWKWWSIKEMQHEDTATFKPEWIPELLKAILSQHQHCA